MPNMQSTTEYHLWGLSLAQIQDDFYKKWEQTNKQTCVNTEMATVAGNNNQEWCDSKKKGQSREKWREDTGREKRTEYIEQAWKEKNH